MTANYAHPILQGNDVHELIPQKSPIVLVDKLFLNDESKTISGYSINDKTLFCEHGIFKEPGIIENMAQTAALRAGYMMKLQQAENVKTNPPIGYIGAIKKLIITKHPKLGDEIITEIQIQQIIFNVTLITAKVTLNEETIATCEMKIFIKPD